MAGSPSNACVRDTVRPSFFAAESSFEPCSLDPASFDSASASRSSRVVAVSLG